MAQCTTFCPHCGLELQAQSEWNGMEIGCPQCQRKFRLNLRREQNNSYAETVFVNPDGTIPPEKENLFTGFARYADFHGRSTRRELALYMILLMAASIALLSLPFLGIFVLPALWLGSAVPSVAITLRRLHDTEWPWPLIFIPGIQFVLLFVPSSRRDNRFGDAPEDLSVAPSIVCAVMAGLYPFVLAITIALAMIFF